MDRAPILFDFVPSGRGPVDALLYKIMRRHARVNREAIWSATKSAWIDLMMHGTAFVKVKWDV